MSAIKETLEVVKDTNASSTATLPKKKSLFSLSKRTLLDETIDIESLLNDTSDDEDDNGTSDGNEITYTIEELLQEEDEDEIVDDAVLSESFSHAAFATPSKRLIKQSVDSENAYYKPAIMTLAIDAYPIQGRKNKFKEGSDTSTSGTTSGKAIKTEEIAKSSFHRSQIARNGRLHDPLAIAEAKERQLLSCVDVHLISPLQVKRRSRSQKQRAEIKARKNGAKMIGKDTALSLISQKIEEQSNIKFPSVIQVQALDVISKQLKKNIEFKEFGPGSPTVIAIHPKFIAIGTSKGLVIIFDHFQNIRQVLGNTVDQKADGPVTAIDVSHGSDFLVCGYQSGRIVLWDMIKGSSLKADAEAHESPVVSLHFLKDQKPILLSVDSEGIVNRVNFNKMMGMVYVVDTDPIYDGSVGKILATCILPQSAPGQAKISTIMEQYSLVALSNEKVTFIVALEPDVKVIYRWARPADVTDEDPVLPSLAFSWVAFPGSARWVAPILARAWGKHVQFLELVFTGGPNHSHSRHGWPTFEELTPVESRQDVMAIQWLGEQIVAYLNAKEEICVYDVLSRQELEIVDVNSLDLVFASYRGKNARSFSNSFRACDNGLYLLGLQELKSARVQPWTQRIDTLIDQGEWMEALALALDNFEGMKEAAMKRAERDRFPPVFFRDKHNDQCLVDILRMCQTNQRTGENQDVFRHEDSAQKVRWTRGEETYPPDLSTKLEETLQKARSGQVTKAFVPISVAERVADLLMEYVRLAIANAPNSSLTLENGGMRLDLSKSHYQMLAGVCIEYCTIINRKDLLFGEIFGRFTEAEKLDIFVELLEPFILCDRVQRLSPEVMQAFVTHFKKSNNLARVEQCLLHLNVKETDLDMTAKLCRQHRLFSALIYIYNEGLDDYVSPIDILLEACSSKANSGSSSVDTEELSASTNLIESQERQCRLYGYKLLLYISYSFKGQTFPRKNQISLRKIDRVRAGIYTHLFTKNVEDTDRPYPRLMTLIELDAKVFLDIIRRTFDDSTIEFEGDKIESTTRSMTRYDSARNGTTYKCPNRLSILLALREVIFGPKGIQDLSSSYFSSLEYSLFFMFEARLLSAGSIDVREYADARAKSRMTDSDPVTDSTSDKDLMMDSLMNFLALGPVTFAANMQARSDSQIAVAVEVDGFDNKVREEILVRLLQKLDNNCYDPNLLLQNVERSKMNRAAVILNKDRGNVMQTIASFLADDEPEFRVGVFNYIRMETERSNYDNTGSNKAKSHSTNRDTIEQAVLQYAPALMETDNYSFVRLISSMFLSLNSKVIQKFLAMGKDGTKLEYLYLKNILYHQASQKGTEDSPGDYEEDFERELLEGTKPRLADDPAVQERFIRLLCEYEPENVFHYLETHDTYRLDTALKLCRDFGITNAEAYLLERTGNVTGALSLILQSLEQKLRLLKPALRGLNVQMATSDARGTPSFRQGFDPYACGTPKTGIIQSVAEGMDALQALDVAVAMCQRNSLRNRDEQAQKLWFTLLDKHLRIQASLKQSLVRSTSSITARGSSQTAFQVALNELIRIILERMASCVALKSILFKIVNEHGRGAFGDFRPTIQGMLDTYNYEESIYHSANDLISTDLYEQVQLLKRNRSRCYAAPSDTCQYCNVLLSKPPFGMAHTGGSNAKWNSLISMVMCTGGFMFHEACGKAWMSRADSRVQPEGGDTHKEITKETDATGMKYPRRHLNTRRYLNRIKNARSGMYEVVPAHAILQSLSQKEAHVQYRKRNDRLLPLRPFSQLGETHQMVGNRRPNCVPREAILKGSIRN